MLCLPLAPLYLPGWLALGLMFLYNWLCGRASAALWEQPVNRWKLFALEVLAFLLYLLLLPLCWYTNGLSWCLSQLLFQGRPDPKEANS
jgi:hypothetical protein